MDDLQGDICRVCRNEAQADRPLYHPCICTGTIRYIHQDCLIQWMSYSHTDSCELCGYRFRFQRIYAENMPRVLPLWDIMVQLIVKFFMSVRISIQQSLMIFSWLGVVPFLAFRISRYLFRASSFTMLLSIPCDIFSDENIVVDTLRGLFVMFGIILTILGLIWLREQIPNRGRPNWLPMIEIEVLVDQPDENQQENNDDDDVQMNDDINVQQARGDANGVGRLAAARLRWRRFIGLDGTFHFLKYVQYMVALNTTFIFILAFWPYCTGNALLNVLHIIRANEKLKYFHVFVASFCGYCFIAFIFSTMHFIADIFGMHRLRWLFGLCYIAIKVLLYVVVEIGILPLLCGWWLDVCSLPLFNVTIKDRITSYESAVGTSIFVLWLFGIICIYLFAAFISLLREILRPGTLWFLRNLDELDFSPIQEIIHLPNYHHLRRLAVSICVIGSAILLMLWIPTKVLKETFPSFLPYKLSSDFVESDLSVEFLLLHFILPGIFERPNTRYYLKIWLRMWCRIFAGLLGMRTYLLGNGNNEHDRIPVDERPDDDVEEYEKPSYLPLRIIGLVLILCVCLIFGSILTLIVPIWIGRKIAKFLSFSNYYDESLWTTTNELFTSAIGVYICWALCRGITIVVAVISSHGRAEIMQILKQWLRNGLRFLATLSVYLLLLVIIPLQFGLLVELAIIIPIRVPLYQTPIHFLWQDWAFGVLYTKVATVIILRGPDWYLKRALQRAHLDGLRNMNLKFLFFDLGMPVIIIFGMALAIPYIVAHSILPLFFKDPITQLEIAHTIYPIIYRSLAAFAFLTLVMKRMKKLYVSVKDDRYLLGQRLLNYEPHN